MKLTNILLLFILCCFSCKSTKHQEEKFEKTKWATKIDEDYPYRDKMLKDVMANQIPHGLKRSEVINLLGQPSRTDTFYLFYKIVQQRLGAFIFHTKTLVIKLNKDSTVEWRKIHE